MNIHFIGEENFAATWQAAITDPFLSESSRGDEAPFTAQ